MAHVPFNVPPYYGTEESYLTAAIASHKICGDGPMTQKCNRWIEERTGTPKALLTLSGTTALDMSAMLLDIQPGDEVIMPSFTFSSTANAFVLRGATIVFVDIRPDTMNLDETQIEAAITKRTKAIVPMHYAGVSCDMDTILALAAQYRLPLVEDAAQGVMSSYQGHALGSMGELGAFSFHETKNYSMGEGGAILINDQSLIERAEIIREKGTDRSRFLRGQVDKYTWVDVGSSCLPSELNAAYLLAQLDHADEINNDRLANWNHYHESFMALANEEKIELPFVPQGCMHNAHMFYIKTRDIEERSALISHLSHVDIGAVFHYIPLHSSPAGQRFGRFHGEDVYTTKESERLLRLPMYYGLSRNNVDRVVNAVYDFYQ
ncbi:MAG: dTDP-4-amino-4,6-dideoxygalactose transaminase [Clostridia bacterium]